MRRRNASNAAELVAPRPNGSMLTYGSIGIVLAGLAMIAFGEFYTVDVFVYPLLTAGLISVAFVAGMVRHRTSHIRHRNACREEYDRRTAVRDPGRSN